MPKRKKANKSDSKRKTTNATKVKGKKMLNKKEEQALFNYNNVRKKCHNGVL
ncbi:MAG: hypothetical protein M3530_01710 [Thermoproteota archaeon]|nr:hypothetical protein [Thermoproteota archaeon]